MTYDELAEQLEAVALKRRVLNSGEANTLSMLALVRIERHLRALAAKPLPAPEMSEPREPKPVTTRTRKRG